MYFIIHPKHIHSMRKFKLPSQDKVEPVSLLIFCHIVLGKSLEKYYWFLYFPTQTQYLESPCRSDLLHVSFWFMVSFNLDWSIVELLANINSIDHIFLSNTLLKLYKIELKPLNSYYYNAFKIMSQDPKA